MRYSVMQGVLLTFTPSGLSKHKTLNTTSAKPETSKKQTTLD